MASKWRLSRSIGALVRVRISVAKTVRAPALRAWHTGRHIGFVRSAVEGRKRLSLEFLPTCLSRWRIDLASESKTVCLV